MRAAIAAQMTTMPEQLRRSLTWDRGNELAQHAQLKIDTGIAVYFADPHSPWQRATNENTNGLLRQYFPKGTDLSRWNAEDIQAVAAALTAAPARRSATRPRPKRSTSTSCALTFPSRPRLASVLTTRLVGLLTPRFTRSPATSRSLIHGKQHSLASTALSFAAARLRDTHNLIINNNNPERLALPIQSGVARTG